MDVLEKVKEVIAGVCEVEASEVKETSTIGDFPAWDSIGHLTIMTTIEEELGVSFAPEEMMELEDVNDIVKAISAKL